MKNPLRSGLSRGGKGVLAVGVLSMALYFSSPKLGHVTHKIKEDISDTLGMKKLLADKETNDIINLMAGKISSEDFIDLLQRHGQKIDSSEIDFNQVSSFDPALYNTILEMQTKYGNPKISFGGNYFNVQKGYNEPDRANFNWQKNTIGIHQLDSAKIKFKEYGNDVKYAQWSGSSLGGFASGTWRSYMVNNWIAELSHAKQLQERGHVKFLIDNDIDELKSPGDHEKLYSMKGTIEHEAHSINEPLLVQEFINTYKKYSKNNAETDFMLAKFYGGYFDAYKDEEKSIVYLQKLSDAGDSLSTYILGKHMFHTYSNHYSFGSGLDKNAKERILDKEYTMEDLFHHMIDLYTRAYYQGFTHAGPEIIILCNNFAYGKNRDFVLKFGEEIISNPPKDIDESQLGAVYRQLANIYYSNGDISKGSEYNNMARELGYVDFNGY